ncbi:MAG: PqqD family peptide modification chaperone [Pseudomonadota bacterium]
MAELTEASVIARGSDFVATQVGNQTMMMSVSAGKYFAVAETAQRIWELLEAPRSIDDIVSVLTSEYDVEADTCRAQVKRFAEDLRENGLVTEVQDGQAA